jgi:hypothetical protein
MLTESPTVQPSHADNCRAGGLKWRGVPPGMSSEIADAMIAKLKDGSTVRKLTCGMKQFGPAMVPWERFKKHCELHPEWAAMAWRISKANTAKGKGKYYGDSALNSQPAFGRLENALLFSLQLSRGNDNTWLAIRFLT